MNKLRSAGVLCSLTITLFGMGSKLAAQQTPTVSRVLLVSIDGFHAIDLDNCVAAGTCPTLAQLSKSGVTYTNASSAKPSDSYPGLMAIATGGSPISTGIWYDNLYDRSYFPPGTTVCTGTPGAGQVYDSALDYDPTKIDGGASSHGGRAINPANLLVDPAHGCKPVFPHNLLRVNTIFEVINQAGLRTAWTDKHPSYEILNGSSGKGVVDLYTPEVDSNISSFSPPPNCTGTIWTDSLCAIEFYDTLKVNAVLHQIDGFDHTGSVFVGVPAIFGMNFQTVSVGQKLANDPAGATGYADVNGTPNPGPVERHPVCRHVHREVGDRAQEEWNLW